MSGPLSEQTQPASAWSRRRAAVQAEAENDARAVEREVLAKQHAELAQKSEEEVLAQLKLPNPDEMKQGDDFSAFMKSAVPSALRNRALRKLWVSNPVLANVDMLVDYGEDFTGKGDVLGAIKTVYRVGKGMLKDEDKQPKPALKPEPVDESEMAVAPEAVNTLVELVEEPEEIIKAPAAKPAPDAVLHRRRMQFAFTDDVSSSTPELDQK